MNRSQLISKSCEVLRAGNFKKPVSVPKRRFTIWDSDGNCANFDVKSQEKTYAYTRQDVSNILDAIIEAVEDTLKQGECISIKGFGSLGLSYRPPRHTYHATTKEKIEIPALYTPKFKFGNSLRVAARLYGDSINNVPQSDICDSDSEGDDEY